MLIPVLLFIVGLLCLIKGGDWFVDGATGIARRFKVPELLIGATVVSIGTTLPEVMVSTTSAMTGHGEIAYGNAIGSVICNAALIAAITIAVRPGKVDPKSLRVPGLFFFVAAALYAGVAYTTGKKEFLDAFLARDPDPKYVGKPVAIDVYMHRDWDSYIEYGLNIKNPHKDMY